MDARRAGRRGRLYGGSVRRHWPVVATRLRVAVGGTLCRAGAGGWAFREGANVGRMLGLCAAQVTRQGRAPFMYGDLEDF